MISIIVAISENNAIGKDNKLLWHMPADMKFFKEKTTEHCVITGRKNYESIPEKFRPLPNRTNIVVTRNKNHQAPGAIVVGSVEEAIEKAKQTSDTEIFIIGGAEIYKQSLHLCDKLYITNIHHSFEADTFFPEWNTNEWELMYKTDFSADAKNPYDYSFCEYVRK